MAVVALEVYDQPTGPPRILAQTNALKKTIAHGNSIGVAAPHPNLGQVDIEAFWPTGRLVCRQANGWILFQRDAATEFNDDSCVIGIRPGPNFRYITQSRRSLRAQQRESHQSE
jgi:hypothetical protein